MKSQFVISSWVSSSAPAWPRSVQNWPEILRGLKAPQDDRAGWFSAASRVPSPRSGQAGGAAAPPPRAVILRARQRPKDLRAASR